MRTSRRSCNRPDGLEFPLLNGLLSILNSEFWTWILNSEFWILSMWHPPQRIKHPLLKARWPSAEEASRSLWFRPLHFGHLRLEERTWVPAMVPWRATEEGFVTQDVLDWYERFAQGQPGALVVEATGVRDVPSGPLLRIGDDRFIPGLRKLVDTVRERSAGHTRLFIQILDFLAVKRRPEPAKYFERFLALGLTPPTPLRRAA